MNGVGKEWCKRYLTESIIRFLLGYGTFDCGWPDLCLYRWTSWISFLWGQMWIFEHMSKRRVAAIGPYLNWIASHVAKDFSHFRQKRSLQMCLRLWIMTPGIGLDWRVLSLSSAPVVGVSFRSHGHVIYRPLRVMRQFGYPQMVPSSLFNQPLSFEAVNWLTAFETLKSNPSPGRTPTEVRRTKGKRDKESSWPYVLAAGDRERVALWHQGIKEPIYSPSQMQLLSDISTNTSIILRIGIRSQPPVKRWVLPNPSIFRSTPTMQIK